MGADVSFSKWRCICCFYYFHGGNCEVTRNYDDRESFNILLVCLLPSWKLENVLTPSASKMSLLNLSTNHGRGRLEGRRRSCLHTHTVPSISIDMSVICCGHNRLPVFVARKGVESGGVWEWGEVDGSGMRWREVAWNWLSEADSLWSWGIFSFRAPHWHRPLLKSWGGGGCGGCAGKCVFVVWQTFFFKITPPHCMSFTRIQLKSLVSTVYSLQRIRARLLNVELYQNLLESCKTCDAFPHGQR